jgi:uncharacterized protein
MTLYLDTSSLVKLYVDEDGSGAVRELLDAAAVVATSAVAYAETRATLARLRREKRLTAAAHTSAKRDLDADWPSYLSIDATDALARAAGDLAERHRLRGFDGLHLASFQQVLERAPEGDVQFSSFDDRLNRAALSLR